MCTPYLSELHMMFVTNGQLKTNILLVLSLTKIKLRTFNPFKPQSRWMSLNDIRY